MAVQRGLCSVCCRPTLRESLQSLSHAHRSLEAETAHEPSATCDVPRSGQEASRSTLTTAVMAGANPSFSRLLTWQISDAALEALLAPMVDIPIAVAALCALLRDLWRSGSSH